MADLELPNRRFSNRDISKQRHVGGRLQHRGVSEMTRNKTVSAMAVAWQQREIPSWCGYRKITVAGNPTVGGGGGEES